MRLLKKRNGNSKSNSKSKMQLKNEVSKVSVIQLDSSE